MFDEMDVRVEAADFLESAKSALEKSTANKASFESELNELKHKLEMLKQEVSKREFDAWKYEQKEKEARALLQTGVDGPNSFWFDILNQWMEFREIRRNGDVLYIEPGFCPCCMDKSGYVDEYANAWMIFLKTVQQLGIRRVIGIIDGVSLAKMSSVDHITSSRFATASCIEDLSSVLTLENADRIGRKAGIAATTFFEGILCVPKILIPVIPGLLIWRDKKDLSPSRLRELIKVYAHK
jgi:hypothetical protein